MPLPAGVETVTVSSGEPLTLPNGTPIQGRLIFTSPNLVTIGEDDLVLGGDAEATLTDGEFSVELVATDATGMSPSGWTYQVRALLTNAPGWTRYLSLPKATPAVALADVLVPDPVEGEFTTLAAPREGPPSPRTASLRRRSASTATGLSTLARAACTGPRRPGRGRCSR